MCIAIYCKSIDARVTWATGTLFLQAFAGSKSSYKKSKNSTTDKTKREIAVESLGLEPLCEEVKTYYFLKFDCFLCDTNTDTIISKLWFSFLLQPGFIFILPCFRFLHFFRSEEYQGKQYRGIK